MKLAYIYSHDIDNPGDLNSSPMHYLGNTCNGVVVDAFAADIPKMSVDVTIIGGGALLTNKKFVRNIKHKLDSIQSKFTVAWGVGYDPVNIDSSIAEQFDLFSTREYKVNANIAWVPCSSVLHKVFRKMENVVPTKDFLVIDSKFTQRSYYLCTKIFIMNLQSNASFKVGLGEIFSIININNVNYY